MLSRDKLWENNLCCCLFERPLSLAELLASFARHIATRARIMYALLSRSVALRRAAPNREAISVPMYRSTASLEKATRARVMYALLQRPDRRSLPCSPTIYAPHLPVRLLFRRTIELWFGHCSNQLLLLLLLPLV